MVFHRPSLTNSEAEHEQTGSGVVSPACLAQDWALISKLARSLPLRGLFWLRRQQSPVLNYLLSAVRWNIISRCDREGQERGAAL